MLRQAKDLEGYKLRAQDADIGRVQDFYFDDRYWTVRYLVADTAGWLSGRRVLISPYALRPANAIDKVLPVELSKKQIEESPSLTAHEPVSRQYEARYYGYYGWPDYAFGPYMWGDAPYLQRESEASRDLRRREDAWDPNLRSTSDVTGHFIQARDGEVGHVVDFLIDDDCWAIRYLVVDTKNWWSGKHVLVSPQWIERVSWREYKVFVNLTRDTIKQAPEYNAASFSREYEAELHKLYTQRGYWVDAPTGRTRSAAGRAEMP
jgi:hypothetical protein